MAEKAKKTDYIRFRFEEIVGECKGAKYSEGLLTLYHTRFSIVKDQIPVAKDAIDAFWETVREIGVWEWNPNYYWPRLIVKEGVHWELEIIHEGTKKKVSGRSVFPPNIPVGDHRSESFYRLCQALNRLAGRDYFKY